MIVPQTLDGYRQDIVAAVEAAKAGYNYVPVIEYDNRILVDTQRLEQPFLSVSIQLSGGQQGDLSDNPFHRFTGLVLLAAKVKVGAGSAESLRLLEHFYTRLHRRRIGQINVEMASIAPPREIEDLWVATAILPIWFNKVY